MSQPKIGLALGSGGARGFAHLGVLRVLRDHQIPVDMIAGSSMGALVAAFYGAGLDIERLYKLAGAFKRKYYLDFTVPKMGFITGKRVKELIRVFTHNKNIEELDIPIAIVATDLIKAERVVFTKGAISPAVRASISIPGIFIPEKIEGRVLVDGGVIDRVPVSVVKELGADIVIGVDVSKVKIDPQITTIFDVILQSIDIMQNELVQHRTNDCDLMLYPHVEEVSARAFTDLDAIIQYGEEETRDKLPAIIEVIEKWKESHNEEN
ncbi:patatin family protein [Bacillus sp. HMF5848]|uniref:patatin-like phospholipase family protein n=1 Tax=Bacillus sp. HMF5848 TaxID=2495421 RepID=UPI000F7A72BB|nr:patatin-like phospholipase family protein [Bacillus sp. HMF5848]RSK26921.1 patatin family protein [Bacillus sp. HMF5848]